LYGRVARNRPSKLLILTCGLSLLVGVCTPAAAGAAGSAAEVSADLGNQVALAGPYDGAYVYDVSGGHALFSSRATTPRPPASVEKLYTATTALELMGPSARLPTTALGVGRLAPGGIWEGNIYLRGGGDPTFGSPGFIRSAYGGVGTSVSGLVTQLVRGEGIHHITGAIVGDESYLDPLRGEPSSNYAPDPFLEGTLSGLAFNRGAVGSERGAHAPAAYAARELDAALRSDGVSIRGRSGAGVTPAGAVQLAQVQSPTLAQLLGLMLPPSDNYFAETLIKDLGARFGGAGTTAAGAAVVTQTIAADFGLHPRLVDGSGLSPADHTTPAQVVGLLTALAPTPLGAVLRSHMAVAGHTGTLALRMRGTAASGRCEAKTGTLTAVSNLAGYCQAANGHTIAFAFFNDGISIEAARTFQDHMAITLAGSNDGLPATASALFPPLTARR
jgi:D-alanyl-D-alanine carboxypeptidase/D-alanyl-D-alanine-endopeptidase (penicillin-binding protein 4)